MKSFKSGDYLPITHLRGFGDGSSYEIVQNGLADDWGGYEWQADGGGDGGVEEEPDQWGAGYGHSDGSG